VALPPARTSLLNVNTNALVAHRKVSIGEGCAEVLLARFARNNCPHILNAARWWTESSSDQQQRVQKVLFPQEVSFANGIYKNTETSLIFQLWQESEGKKTRMATLPGIEPGLLLKLLSLCESHICRHLRYI